MSSANTTSNLLRTRTSKIDFVANETTLYYNNNNWQVLAETDANGTTQRWFIHGNGTESPLRRIDEVLVMVPDANWDARKFQLN